MNNVSKLHLSVVCMLTITAAVVWKISPSDAVSLKRYASVPHGIAFPYLAEMHLQDREDELGNPQLAIVLVEKTPSNIAYLAGKPSVVGEAPPVFTIDVYGNPGIESASVWMQQQTNWIVADKPSETILVNGREGLLFFWDGLYAGKTAVVVRPERVYVFAVGWITAQDKLVEQFDSLLAAVKLF